MPQEIFIISCDIIKIVNCSNYSFHYLKFATHNQVKRDFLVSDFKGVTLCNKNDGKKHKVLKPLGIEIVELPGLICNLPLYYFLGVVRCKKEDNFLFEIPGPKSAFQS